MLKAVSLTCESLLDPIGLYTMRPRFSWLIETSQSNAIQEFYRIKVSRDDEVVWDSGDVESDRSVLIEYAGEPLAFETVYTWCVKITVNGEECEWSEPASFETALETWTAGFIAADDKPETSEAKIFRCEFTIDKPVKSARVYATALGLYEMYISGVRVSDTFFDPGCTSYDKRVLYQTYDVTDNIRSGINEITATVGAGWYKGDFGFKGGRGLYGDKMAFSAMVVINYCDGKRDVIKTDETWKFAESPVVSSEIYHGETYDARNEIPGDWKFAVLYNTDTFIIEPFDGVPVRCIDILKPVEYIKTPKGEHVLDFGQNITGRVRFSVEANSGDTVKLRHAEVLDKDGNFYTANLRTARCTDTYICKGGGKEEYEPHFTFHGFRYVCLDEYPGEIIPDNFNAVVLHSDMKPTGSFSCSNPLINRLQSNIIWGLKGNFLDIPTDCPQRDERMGWTGDAQAFSSTACYLYDVLPFFRKWLRDLTLDQMQGGAMPYVIPDVLIKESPLTTNHSACGWGDAAVIIPWTLYMAFGDRRILEDQYNSMKSWVNYIRSQANDNLWNTGFHFGDWVALDSRDGGFFGATPTDLCATAFYAYSTELLTKAAEVLGKEDDVNTYKKLHSDILEAFKREFFTLTGRLAADTQTSHILALMFGLVPPEFVSRTVDRLLKLIKEHGGHFVTGFLGTSYFCHTLSRNNNIQEAYKLLEREEYPSWLFPVKMGATTIWERLNGISEDGTLGNENMNSFNHYAYGAIGAWLYEVVVGINPVEPGYKRILIAPQPGGEMTWAEGKLLTQYGEIASKWERSDGCITFEIKIPPNTTADIKLPDGSCYSTGSGEYIYKIELNQVRG